ncbi:MAG: molecular chaperone DnaJ [Myxococcota bacterium]
MGPSDPYAILGVSKTASAEDIKRSYREIARKYHPDKNPGDAEAQRIFSEAAEAYRVLGDPELRAEHDRRAARLDNPSELFEEIFGSRDGTRRPPRSNAPRAPESLAPKRSKERGEDLRYTLDLSFEEAAFGGNHEIVVPRRVRCEPCGGSGAKAGSALQTCPTCGGAGNIRTQQGFFTATKTCARCGGAGRTVVEACPECKGTGETTLKRTLVVSVPPGVEEGTRLKLGGEGELGKAGGTAGDLFVVIHLVPHPFFVREGADITVEIPVRFAQAALGDTIEVPTLEGLVRMRVPPGSQSGRVFRLKAKGLPLPDGRGRGDQRVRILVEVPTYLTDEQRSLLERFDDGGAEAASPLVKEFKEKLEKYARVAPE